MDTAQKIFPLPAEANAVSAVKLRANVREDRVGELLGLAAILGQVGLIALIMRYTSLETYALHRVTYIAIVGFVINHWLPIRLRLPFFTILSMAAMVLVLGETPDARIFDLGLGLSRAGAILTMGAILIGICHLPVGFWFRAGLLVTAGLVAVVFRAGLWESAIPAIVWPVLAAMFMFRVMVYLYDVTNAPERPSVSQSLAYFFLLPNVCTLLFPVIDFGDFRQKYYDEDALVIYQRGAKWMARGVIQLLLYRLVSRLLALDASDVSDGTDLIRFVVTNVFLYLKVSGGFHLIIGLLLLFGFNLPETNRRYFLASSFTDYWRRVNIYWRIFIMKVYYYPVYYRFKGLGPARAMVIATLWCFFMTWALHLYQTWWVTGTVSSTWADALFWTALALLVLFNSLWELKRNRRRKLTVGRYNLKEATGLIMRTAGTFAVISILWSLWSTPTITQWLHLWSLTDWHTLAWGGLALGVVMAATVVFEIMPALWRRPASAGLGSGGYVRTAGFRHEVLLGTVPLMAICVLTHPAVKTRLDLAGRQLAGAGALIHVFSDGEATQRGRGYYENLAAPDKGTGQFWETMNLNFVNPILNLAMRHIDALPFVELIPNAHLEKNGLRMDTNRWGMRDQDYGKPKPSGTLRVAMLGSSHLMGFGLPVQDMFEPAIEGRLNREHSQDGHFEVLNFGINGLSPIGQLWLVSNRVPEFRPDVMLLVTHLVDFEWATRDVARSVRRGIPLPDRFPDQILAQARVDQRTSDAFAAMRLRPYDPEILSFCYEQIVQKCRSIAALPVCVFLPVPDDLPLDEAKTENLLRRAQDAGFIVIDLSDIYAGQDPKDFMLAERGHHSNAKANALIAAALYDRLTTDPRIGLLNHARRLAERDPAGVASTQSSLSEKSP